MTIRLGCAVKDIAVKANGVEVTLADGRVVRSDILLYAAGRSGNVGSLGLETVGIAKAVGEATRNTVVASCLAILLGDYLLTSLLPFGFKTLKVM